MATTYHLSLSVRGMLRYSNRELRAALKWTKDDQGKPFRDIESLREALMTELAQGHEVLPTGPCEGFDFKDGCPGHVEQEPPR